MMMLKLVALLFVSLYSVNGQCVRNGVRCLEYTVLQTHEGYEEREYPPITWVSATAVAKRKVEISRFLVKQLYKYLAGDNDKGEILDKAVPYRTTKVFGEAANTYTISIPLLGLQSEGPPIPVNPNVTITTEPKTVYVVKSFGGHVRRDEIWDHQADMLKNSVPSSYPLNTGFYFMNVYDSPWREADRLNEVWMSKLE